MSIIRAAEKKLKEVMVKTNQGTDHYYGWDAQMVAQQIFDANMNGLAMTFPIWVADDAKEVQYTLANIVQVEKLYFIQDED